MKKIEYNDFRTLLSTEYLFFINSYEKAVIRTSLINGSIIYYVKFKGDKEFETKPNNKIVTGGLEEHTIISQEEYENY